MSSRINHQIGKEELDNGNTSSLRHVAPLFGNIHLIYKRENIKADLYLYYNGEISYANLAEEERSKIYQYAIDKNGNPYSPSWINLNLKLSYHMNKKITILAGIENITDQRYRPYSSGISAPGRNFIVSTKISF